MLVRNSNGRSEVIDFRETAAASAHRDMFNHNTTLATDSTLSAGVPGEILGFATAHQRHGKLPWAVLFGPSISLAREGFPVTAKMADMISVLDEREGWATNW
jgi:gamma-glutamyltranspeptidase/glutathione hydrolase/leukotriene-C4 hydrolase